MCKLFFFFVSSRVSPRSHQAYTIGEMKREMDCNLTTMFRSQVMFYAREVEDAMQEETDDLPFGQSRARSRGAHRLPVLHIAQYIRTRVEALALANTPQRSFTDVRICVYCSSTGLRLHRRAKSGAYKCEADGMEGFLGTAGVKLRHKMLCVCDVL